MSINFIQKAEGTIVNFNAKGFGFISLDNNEKHIFFEQSKKISIDNTNLGARVRFSIVSGDKGPKAIDVVVLSETIPAGDLYELSISNTPAEIDLVAWCTDELIRHLQAHPADLYQIHPKTFEEIIAAIFRNEGFDTELVGSWNQPDGGVDVIAVRKYIDGVTFRTAIQCKRYKPERHVSVDHIRSLAGVLDRFHAHAGVVATTSYFTQPAKEESQNYFWRISLLDYDNIVNSLKVLGHIS